MEAMFKHVSFIFLLIIAFTTAQNSLPYLSATGNGNLTIVLPAGASMVMLQYMDNNSIPLSEPVPLATQDQLVAVHAQLAVALSTAAASLENRRASVVTQLAQNQSSILAHVEANVLRATVGKLNADNISALDPHIKSVVEGMVGTSAPASDLKVAIDGKLTSAPTCSCYNPATFQPVAANVDQLVEKLNSTIACEEQGLTFRASQDACRFSYATPDCGSRIPGLDPNAASACGLTVGSTKAGASCVATCNAGYTGGRTATFTCATTGLWTGSISCPASSCPALPAPVNGQKSSTAVAVGTTVSFSCDPGFYLIGVASSVCGSNAQWTASSPACRAFCPALSSPVNGTVISPMHFTVGHVASYSCDSRFVLVGQATLVCHDTGDWSATPPTCVDPCTPPTAPTNGAVNLPSGPIVPGTTVFFSCDSGRTVSGFQALFCMVGGVWSNPFPTCV